MQASMANREPPFEPAANSRVNALPAPPSTEKKPLAKIVHELRNPLSAFTTALHLLTTQSEKPDVVRQLAGMMTQQLDRFAQIVEDLAALSADAQAQPYQNAAVDPLRPGLPAM